MSFNFMLKPQKVQKLGKDADKIQDVLFKEDSLMSDYEENVVNLDFSEDFIEIVDADIKPFKIIKGAFDQILKKVKIPLVYAYDLDFEMLEYNLTRRCEKYQKDILLRVRNDSETGEDFNTIRAVLSKRYNVISNLLAFTEFKEVLEWSGMEVEKALLSDHIFQTLAKGSTTLDGDVCTGLEVVNGETGYRSLELNTTINFSDTYMIIAKTRKSSKYNLKATHLKKGLKDIMKSHALDIVNNLDTFKTAVKAAKESKVSSKDLYMVKDKMDLVFGRKSTRDALENFGSKTKLEASHMLAQMGDSLSDIEKQRLAKIAAGELFLS